MVSWHFELVGNDVDLEQLASLFEEGPVRVARVDGKFWMQSDTIPADETHEAARAEAEILLKTVNGLAVLASAGTGLAALGTMIQEDAAGRRHIVVVPGPATLKVRMLPAKVEVGGVVQRPKQERFLGLALGNPEIDHVLRMYGSRHLDWRDLYAILEVVEKNLGMTVAKKGWASSSERDRFRQTANSRKAIGDLARHGEIFEAPKSPMTLAEARHLGDYIVDRWLTDKLATRVRSTP